MAYMRPRMLLLGVAFTLSALVYFVKLRLGLPKIASIAHFVLTAAVLVYGFWMFHDAAKRFW
jgi:high-affinity Fe2+/Pb2+ permease